MKKTVLLIATLLAASLAFGQAEHLKATDAVGVTVGHASPSAIAENIRPGLPHVVHFYAWHNAGTAGCPTAKAEAVFEDGVTAPWKSRGLVEASGKRLLGHGCPYFDTWTHNLRTNAGADVQASQMANTATQAAACNFFALAADSSNAGAGTIAATDTTLASSGTGSTEITTNGLARAQATYAHTTGTATFTLTHTFTDTTASTSGVNKTAVFNAAASGQMCFEALFTSVTLNVNDTLAETYTVNY